MKHSVRPEAWSQRERNAANGAKTHTSEQWALFLSIPLLTSIQGKIMENAEFLFFYHSFNTHLLWFVSGRAREESRQIFTAPFHNWVTTQKQSYFWEMNYHLFT